MEDAVLEALGVMGMNRLKNAVKRGDIDMDEIPGMRAGEGTTMFSNRITLLNDYIGDALGANRYLVKQVWEAGLVRSSEGSRRC